MRAAVCSTGKIWTAAIFAVMGLAVGALAQIDQSLVTAATEITSLPFAETEQWTSSSPVYSNWGNERYVGVYKITLTGNTVEILLGGANGSSDTYLYVLDENGNVVTSNDDGGDSRPINVGGSQYYANSFVTLSDIGIYYILASHYSSLTTGSYAIEVKAPGKPIITTTSLYGGYVGEYYRQNFNTTSRATEWEITAGALPQGLDFYTDYGYIEGTPEQEGSSTFTVTARNSVGEDSKQFTLSIQTPPAPVITTTSLPNAETGTHYWTYLNATRNARWSIEIGALPSGLTLTEYGEIYGTPTQTGTSNFTVKAANAGGNGTKAFTITTTAPQPPAITTTTLPSGVIGNNYGQQIQATGYNITWSKVGVWPSWLDYSTGGGTGYSYLNIYGTPQGTGTYTFTVKAENGVSSVQRTFTIKIKTVAITTTTLSDDGEVGVNYSRYIYATGSDLTWELVGAPSWLQLQNVYQYTNDSEAHIRGTPAAAGTFTFKVIAKNTTESDTATYTIEIKPLQKPVITASSLPNGQKGVFYGQWIADGSNIEWSVVSGTLPPGLELGGSDIYGIPTATGTYTFTVKAENDAGSVTKAFTVTIAPPPAPIIEYSNMPVTGEVGVYYYGNIETNVAGVTWELVNAPSWLQINEEYYGIGSSSVRIHGIPTQSTTLIDPITFTVVATNESGSAERQFTINDIAPPAEAPSITWTGMPVYGQAGGYYYGEIEAYYAAEWSIVNGPAWLAVEESGWNNSYWNPGLGYARIGGTPTEAGQVSFTVKAKNETGEVTRDFTVDIGELQQPYIYSSNIPNGGQVSANYNGEIGAGGYNITWSIVSGSGNLPPGLELVDQSNGHGNSHIYVRGTPTTVGTYTFTVKADNGVGDGDTRQFTVAITALEPPVITTETLPNGEKGASYDWDVSADGYNIEWSVIGSLPPGLQRDSYQGSNYSNMYIYGTPTTVGPYKFKVVAKNAAGSDTAEYTVTVTELQPPVITTTILPGGETGNYYSSQVRANGSNVTWSVVAGSLPPGFNIYGNHSSTDGNGQRYSYAYIEGAPNTAGAYTFTVKATNAAGSDEQELTIGINVPPVITADLPDGLTGKPYQGQVTVYGTTYDPYDWSVFEGELPDGLNISVVNSQWNGSTYNVMYNISGTPTGAGEYSVKVSATNRFGDEEETFTGKIWEQYTISFVANYTGGTVSPATGTTGIGGQLVTSLPKPSRTGYTLVGWYNTADETGGKQINASTVFTASIPIYARWKAKSSGGDGGDDDEPETYKITFDANGGAVSPASRKTNTSGKVSLPTPEREGYTFDGWYTKTTGGSEVTKNTEFDDEATIYAHWTIKSYKVTFSAGANGVITAEVGGKDIKTGAEVDYGESVKFTAEPADGYKVSGWKLGNKTVSGNKTETYTVGEVKEAVTVTVSFAKTDAILTPDRVIPNAKPDEEATVVAPVSQLSGEFTAGPNPVNRQLGNVGFFRQGKRVASGELRIYDAVGNVVSKVKISDKALGSQARRQVGSWDLTDVKGRPVSEGTYLVRGVLKTSDGKKEKVSVIVGVR